MTADDHAVRATSFGAIAEDYDRFRPGPPMDALDWILPARCGDVVDIGAGTGALTRLLTGRADRVVAVEPDPRMAAVLTLQVPGARATAGRAEELPLSSGSFDAVVGSSMWHWVDPARASLEAARVLRPGGVLGILWSGPDRAQPWLADLLARARPAAPAAGTEVEALIPHRRHMDLSPEAAFSAPETHTLSWSLTVTPDHLVAMACTFSAFLVLPVAEQRRRRDEVAEAVRRHPDLAGRRQIELPLRCLCRRAYRLGPGDGR